MPFFLFVSWVEFDIYCVGSTKAKKNSRCFSDIAKQTVAINVYEIDRRLHVSCRAQKNAGSENAGQEMKFRTLHTVHTWSLNVFECGWTVIMSSDFYVFFFVGVFTVNLAASFCMLVVFCLLFYFITVCTICVVFTVCALNATTAVLVTILVLLLW